jgi:hypothetical protein
MAEATRSSPYGYDVDDEVRDSLRAIKKERNVRSAIAVAIGVAIVAIVSFSLYYAYSSEPGAGAIPGLQR